MTPYRIVPRQLEKERRKIGNSTGQIKRFGGRDMDLENRIGDFKWFWSGVKVCESQTNVLNCLF